MKIVFFNRPKARQFDYIPRFYDKEKEEWEQKKREAGIIDKGDRRYIKGELKGKWQRGRQQNKSQSNSIRSIMYLMLLILGVYIIFFTDFVQRFVTSLLGN